MVLVARTSAPKLDIRLQMMCNVEAVGLPFKPNTVFWEMGEWQRKRKQLQLHSVTLVCGLVVMCLDDVVMAFYRRLFRSRPRTANTDEHQKMGGYVEMADVQSNSWNHRTDERRNTSESENVVVMDGETYQQMKTEFKALEATILQLQHVLIEVSGIHCMCCGNVIFQTFLF